MKREEAIKTLKGEAWICCSEKWNEALAMALKALEKEPCGDAISRQAALNAMCALCNTGETLKENPWRDNPHIDTIIDALDNLQPVTPWPKTGHWKQISPARIYECDICGQNVMTDDISAYRYCHGCGAKMVEPQESEKYCDRNICVSNEYNGIGCDECEVTKSREPQEREE